MSDAELLQRYAQDGTNDAFASLIGRHLNLVYSVARRHVHSAALAEDVAQSVFTELACSARHIKPGTPLVAWLHVVSRRKAINAARGEARRAEREHEAAELESMKSDPAKWSAVEPLLDEAVESLEATDRTAILLRYFENKNLREVGAALGTSDDAAQKRVTRAVEQLRAFFLRRGVTVTATGLATDLSAHALHVAPAGLGATISSAAALASSHSATSIAAVSFTMTTLEKAMLGAALALALGGAVFEATRLRASTTALTNLRQQNESIAAQIDAAQRQREVAQRHTAETLLRLAAHNLPPEPVAAPAVEAELTAWLKRAARLRQLREQRTELSVPEFQFLQENDWFQAAREGRLDSEADIREKFAQLRWDAEYAFVTPLQRALGAYLFAHDGVLPNRVGELVSYFDPLIDPAVLARYEMMVTGKLSELPSPRGKIIAQKSPRDPERDSVWQIGLGGWSSGRAQNNLSPLKP